MPSSGIWRRVAHVRTDVLEVLLTAKFVAYSVDVFTLMMEEIRSSEMSVLTRATRRNIAEGAILYSHRRENLKSYNFDYV
jgi:hypothetical protein